MTIAGSLVVNFSARTDEFDRGVQRVKGGLDTVRGMTGTATFSMQEFDKATSTASSSLALFGTGIIGLATLKTFTQDVVDATIKSQALSASFTAITGSSQTAVSTLGTIRALANKLGLEFTSLAGGFKNIAAATRGTSMEGKEAEHIFTAFVTTGRTLRLSNEDIAGSLIAIGQMFSKGKITAEEWTQQLGERMPVANQAAARAIGRTVEEFQTLLTTGGLSLSMLSRVADELLRTYGQAGPVTGLDSAFNHLKNSWTDFLVAFGNTGVMSAAATFLEHMGRGLHNITVDIDRIVAWRQGKSTASEAMGETIAEINRLQTLMAALEKGQNSGALTNDPAIQRLREQLTIQQDIMALLTEGARRKAELDPLGGEIRPPKVREDKEAAFQLQLKRTTDELNESYERTIRLLKILDEQMTQNPSAQIAIMEQKKAAVESYLSKVALIRITNPQVLPALGLDTASRATSVNPYRGLMESAGQQYGVSPTLLEAVTKVESNFDPRAVSRTGAQGLMQLMPGTSAGLGVSNAFDPAQNIGGGAKYLAQLSARYHGNLDETLAAYNAGPGKVPPGGGVPQITETIDYVQKVKAALGTGGLMVVSSEQAGRLQEMTANLLAIEKASLAPKAFEQFIQIAETLDQEGTKLLTTDEEFQQGAAKAVLELQQKKAELMAAFLRDPVGASQQVLEWIAKLQEGIGKAYNAQTIKTFRVEQERADVSFLASLQAEYQQLTVNEEKLAGYADAQRQRHIADMALRDEELGKEAQSIQQRIKSKQSEIDALEIKHRNEDAIAGVIRGLADEARQLTMTSEQLVEYQLKSHHADESTLSLAKSMETLNQYAKYANQAADLITNSLVDMAATGQMNLEQLGQSFHRLVLGALVDAIGLKQTLSTLFQRGFQALGLTTGSPGDPSAPMATIGENGIIDSMGTTVGIAGARAAGGPVMPRRFYMVGEQGPELFSPTTPGTIIPNNAIQMGQRPIEIHVHGVTDAGSFVRSSGQIQRALWQATQQAGRAA